MGSLTLYSDKDAIKVNFYLLLICLIFSVMSSDPTNLSEVKMPLHGRDRPKDMDADDLPELS